MKLNESQLRNLIRLVLKEDAGGPSALKQSSTDIIQAINDDNPASFWGAFLTNLEGLAGTAQHAPGADKMEIQKFISTIQPAAKLCNHLRNAHQTDAKEKAGQYDKKSSQNQQRHEALVRELSEPFELDIVSKLVSVNKELDKVAFSDDEKFDAAFEELAAAHTAISRLVNKLRQPQKPRLVANKQYVEAKAKKPTKKRR